MNDPDNEWIPQKDPQLDPEYDPDHPFRNLPENLGPFREYNFPEESEEKSEPPSSDTKFYKGEVKYTGTKSGKLAYQRRRDKQQKIKDDQEWELNNKFKKLEIEPKTPDHLKSDIEFA